MFKSIVMTKGIKDIVSLSLFVVSTLLTIYGLYYAHTWPQHYFKNIDTIKICYISVPIVGVFIYSLFIRQAKKLTLIDLKYLNKVDLNWSTKVLILGLGSIAADIGSDIVRNGMTENQKVLDENDRDFLTTLLGSGGQAPILEEIMFRGLIFLIIMSLTSYINKKLKKNIGFIGILVFIIVSSSVFGLLHVVKFGDYEHTLTYAIPGLVYSIVFVLTRDIKIPILLHMLNNVTITLNKHEYMGLTLLILVSFYILIIVAIFKIALTMENNKKYKELRNRFLYKEYIYRKKRLISSIDTK